MRWLADECVDLGLVLELRRLGEDVEYISETPFLERPMRRSSRPPERGRGCF